MRVWGERLRLRLFGETPAPWHRVRAAAEDARLRLLRPADEWPGRIVNANAEGRPWRAEPDDLIGAWCVVVDRRGTPATGNPPLGTFISQRLARHIAQLHNDWLRTARQNE